MSSARAKHWNIVLHPTRPSSGSASAHHPPKPGGARPHHDKKALAHPDRKPFTCHLCSRRFERSGHLKTHITAVHEQKQPYKCDFPNCGLSFGHRSSLSRHRKGIHKLQG